MKTEVMHFKSQKERLDYLRGNFEEIVPQEVVVPKKEEKVVTKAETPCTDASEKKPKRAKKGKKKNDAVQAE